MTTLEAIVAWVKSRPAAPTEHLLLSLPRTGQPKATDHAGRRPASSPATPRQPTFLKIAARRMSWANSFCTHLADSGADVATIRELPEIRTITTYTAVSSTRLERAITSRAQQRKALVWPPLAS